MKDLQCGLTWVDRVEVRNEFVTVKTLKRDFQTFQEAQVDNVRQISPIRLDPTKLLLVDNP